MNQCRLSVLLCAIVLLGLSAAVGVAAPQQNYKTSAPAGTTYHQFGTHLVEVSTTARVTVYAVISGSVIIGAVEPTTDGPVQVTITLILTEQEDEILFEGTVKKYTTFEELLPHETGHGEGAP